MQNDSNRRNFLKGSTAAAAGAALTSTIARTAHAAGSDE
ncbi:MAG: twin-arginine translocation signal domain-containing protein, partial [Planctomycetota bacterium]|nr:twin-arginine translocation signal domain-containing protein [Planctomycetota bacterium]